MEIVEIFVRGNGLKRFERMIEEAISILQQCSEGDLYAMWVFRDNVPGTQKSFRFLIFKNQTSRSRPTPTMLGQAQKDNWAYIGDFHLTPIVLSLTCLPLDSEFLCLSRSQLGLCQA